ncbi:phospholipid carrier-dependent glycosyltransferase [Patescibacteria group bacterium]
MSKSYQIKTFFTPKKLLFLLLIFSFFIRVFRISVPQRYIFDEVYHVVAVKAIAKNNPDAYNPYAKSPEKDTAYDWLHPPLAKLIQASSVKLLGENSFAWRLPSAIFGTLSIFALYYLALTITKNPNLALLAATLFSLDNLQLTMSRIVMNDIFLTTFIIFALTFFYKVIDRVRPCQSRKHLLLTGLFTGLSLATKHSAVLLFPIFSIFLMPIFFKLIKTKKYSQLAKQLFRLFISLVILPLYIYLLSYLQMFLQGKDFKDLFNLHKQIYNYQTNLTATHDYQSSAWQWPLLIRPVWFHVDYRPDTVANTYNLGNPAIFWGGLIVIVYSLLKKPKQLFPLISYFLLFLPFAFSPRIMFFHHYLPALPLFCLILAQTIYKHKKLVRPYLLFTLFLFLFFYPISTAIPIPKDLLKFWFWLPTWK